MQEAQAQVSDFIAQNDSAADAAARLMDLQSEFGELAKEFLKASDYGRTDFAPNADWADEIGDVPSACWRWPPPPKWTCRPPWRLRWANMASAWRVGADVIQYKYLQELANLFRSIRR